MFVYILGIIDLLAAANFFALQFAQSVIFTIIIAAILAIKSFFYISDVASWVDLAAAFFMLLALVNYYPLTNYFFILWLLQKGARSFF